MATFTEGDIVGRLGAGGGEGMALRYWEKEFEAHGYKMLAVSTTVPVELPYRKDSD